MYIVFDTNIWRKELGFNSLAGSAVRFYIQQCGATVAIPEVVRLEIERRFEFDLKEMKKKIIDFHRQILTVFGELKDVDLPSDEEICVESSKIIEELDVPLKEIPFSMEAAKSSFLKTVNKHPPSHQKEQFKDGVIWADCLKLLEEADVYFVTKDNAFYKGGDYKKGQGLASNLLEEANKCPHNLKLISELSDLLKDIRQEVEIDKNILVKSVLEKSGEAASGIVEDTGFFLGDSPEIIEKLFSTESSTRLYIEFEICYQCPDATDQGRPVATLRLEGHGSYKPQKQEYRNLTLTNVIFQYIDDEGKFQSRGHYSVSAQPIYLGHPTVKHKVRYELSD